MKDPVNGFPLDRSHKWSVAMAGLRSLHGALRSARILSARGFTAHIHRVVWGETGRRFATVFPRKRYPRFEER